MGQYPRKIIKLIDLPIERKLIWSYYNNNFIISVIIYANNPSKICCLGGDFFVIGAVKINTFGMWTVK